MNLSFASDEEDDILNATIHDSDTNSVMYTFETPKHAGGTLTTTVTRHNQIDGSTRLVFRILWKGETGSLDDAEVVLDFRTLDEIPVKEIMESMSGCTTWYVHCWVFARPDFDGSLQSFFSRQRICVYRGH